jgi:hypothetical protein
MRINELAHEARMLEQHINLNQTQTITALFLNSVCSKTKKGTPSGIPFL